jgi:hypothetical protein
MLARVQEAKRQGKPLPQNIDDMERTVGGMSNAAVSGTCAAQPRLCCPCLVWHSLSSTFVNPGSRIAASLLHACRYMAQLQATAGPRAAAGASAGWQNAASYSAKQRYVLEWKCSWLVCYRMQRVMLVRSEHASVARSSAVKTVLDAAVQSTSSPCTWSVPRDYRAHWRDGLRVAIRSAR